MNEVSHNAGSRLNVAVLTRELPSVSETFVADQIVGLRALGHDVTVFAVYRRPGAPGTPGATRSRAVSGDPDQPPVRYLIGPHLPTGRKWLRAMTRAARSLAFPGSLLRLLSVPTRPHVVGEAIHAIPVLDGAKPGPPGAFDVVHAHFGSTGLLALALRRMRLLTGPLVTTFHGVDLTSYPRVSGDVYEPLFEAGDAFTVNSRFSLDLALRLGAPPNRIHQVPVGVDPARIPFRARSRGPAEPLRLLSVGRLEPVKGLSFGLAAVARLVAEGLDVRYTIVGTGRLSAELRQEAARLGIDDRVRFTGPLPYDAVVAEYGRHHLFLMPGIVTEDGQQEAQGRVLVEAQAAGLPVVASRVGGIPETLAEGAGRLVPPEDPEALAGAVRELAADPGSWPAMGEQGRRRVETQFDANRLLDGLVNVYRAAMAHAGAGT